MHSTRRVGRGLALLAALVANAAHGQETAVPTYQEWRLLESAPEMIEFRSHVRDGVIDDADRAFLTKTALPHLALPRNRPMIDRIRRRMRDVLCGGQGSDPKVVAAVNQVVAGFMGDLARDPKADMVARVNAVLMVGELRAADGKPWPPAATPLAALLRDDAMPAAVRVAAAAGLARQVEADPAARAADIGPTLLAVASAPLAGIDPVAADWLRSRTFAALERMGSTAPDGTAAAAAGVLRDRSRPVDLRVRAAATLGRCIKAAGDTDVAAAVAVIRDLATGVLVATTSDIERRDLAARLASPSGVAPRPDSRPADDFAGGPSQVFRRDAWRLAKLANAIDDGEDGLARVAGANAAAAQAFAQALRDGAAGLDAEPGVEALDAALAFLTEAATARAVKTTVKTTDTDAGAEPDTGTAAGNAGGTTAGTPDDTNPGTAAGPVDER